MMNKLYANKKIRLVAYLFAFLLLLIVFLGCQIYLDVYRLEGQLTQNLVYRENHENQDSFYPLSNSSHAELNVVESRPVYVGKVSGGYFIEFDKSYYGTVKVRVISDHPAVKVRFVLGERKIGDNQVWTPEFGVANKLGAPASYVVEAEVKSDSEFTLPLPSRHLPRKQDLPDGIDGVIPFRFCGLYFEDDSAHIKYVVQLGVVSPLGKITRFSSSDSVLNEVWDLASHTLVASTFSGMFLDGDRERLPYEADLYVAQLGQYALSQNYKLVRRTFDYLLDHPTWPSEWQIQGIFIAYQDYLRTGDSQYLKRNWPRLEVRTLQKLARTDGLISTEYYGDFYPASFTKIEDIIDWPPGERRGFARENGGGFDCRFFLKKGALSARLGFARLWGFPNAERSYAESLSRHEGKLTNVARVNSVVNAFYYRGLVLMSELASELKMDSESRRYKTMAAQVKDAFNKVFWDVEKNVYRDAERSKEASFQANVFALAFDLVLEDRKPHVVEFIKRNRMGCSVYCASYLIPALFDAGEGDYAISLITSKTPRSWWGMKNLVGSTMTLESWNSEYKSNMDWNHVWGASPVYFVVNYMLGLKIHAPHVDSKKIELFPQVGEIQRINMDIPLFFGKDSLIVEYRSGSDGNEIHIDLGVPNECIVELFLPVKNGVSYFVRGKGHVDTVDHVKHRSYVGAYGQGHHKVVLNVVHTRS